MALRAADVDLDVGVVVRAVDGAPRALEVAERCVGLAGAPGSSPYPHACRSACRYRRLPNVPNRYQTLPSHVHTRHLLMSGLWTVAADFSSNPFADTRNLPIKFVPTIGSRDEPNHRTPHGSPRKVAVHNSDRGSNAGRTSRRLCRRWCVPVAVGARPEIVRAVAGLPVSEGAGCVW